VQYGTLPYDVLLDKQVIAGGGPLQGYPDESWNLGLSRFVSAFWKASSRILTLPQGVMYWKPNPLDPKPNANPESIRMGIPFKEGGGTLTLIWHRVPLPAIPFGAIQACQNCINDTPFFNSIFPAQTVLFEDHDRKPVYLPNGLRAYDINYVFKVRFNVSRGLDGQGQPNPNPPVARGWNWGLRSIGGKLDYRERSTYQVLGAFPWTFIPGDNPYKTADLTSLFRPDQPS
jgi:hypothetical protein